MGFIVSKLKIQLCNPVCNIGLTLTRAHQSNVTFKITLNNLLKQLAIKVLDWFYPHFGEYYDICMVYFRFTQANVQGSFHFNKVTYHPVQQDDLTEPQTGMTTK